MLYSVHVHCIRALDGFKCRVKIIVNSFFTENKERGKKMVTRSITQRKIAALKLNWRTKVFELINSTYCTSANITSAYIIYQFYEIAVGLRLHYMHTKDDDNKFMIVKSQ